LFFDGDVTYNATTGSLSVTSVLTATEDLGSITISGSSLTFSAMFDEAILSSRTTLGLFSGVVGNDIVVEDGDNNSLLVGEFDYLEMLGRNGRDAGIITGVVNATGGSLADMFGAGNLFALEFNLSTVFSEDMFGADFSGLIDGRIEGQSVPEPNIVALLGLGLALIGFIRSRQSRI
jgi:hypothetical protein